MTRLRAARAAVVAVLVAGCVPADLFVTCEEQAALDTAAIEEIWPQGFERSGSIHGVCGDSTDEVSMDSTSFPAHELRDAVRRLQDQGWELSRRGAYETTLARDDDEGHEFTAWVAVDGDEARLAIGVSS